LTSVSIRSNRLAHDAFCCAGLGDVSCDAEDLFGYDDTDEADELQSCG
jgi:hypothetical protein